HVAGSLLLGLGELAALCVDLPVEGGRLLALGRQHAEPERGGCDRGGQDDEEDLVVAQERHHPLGVGAGVLAGVAVADAGVVALPDAGLVAAPPGVPTVTSCTVAGTVECSKNMTSEKVGGSWQRQSAGGGAVAV